MKSNSKSQQTILWQERERFIMRKKHGEESAKFFQSHTGPMGAPDLHFRSPRSNTSLYYENRGHGDSASRGVSVYFPAKAGTHLPIDSRWMEG